MERQTSRKSKNWARPLVGFCSSQVSHRLVELIYHISTCNAAVTGTRISSQRGRPPYCLEPHIRCSSRWFNSEKAAECRPTRFVFEFFLHTSQLWMDEWQEMWEKGGNFGSHNVRRAFVKTNQEHKNDPLLCPLGDETVFVIL